MTEMTRIDEAIERRFWQLTRELGGTTAAPGWEVVHRHAERAACHVAACRYLEVQDTPTATADAAARRAQAGEAIRQALAAYPVANVARDRVGDELVELARQLGRFED